MLSMAECVDGHRSRVIMHVYNILHVHVHLFGGLNVSCQSVCLSICQSVDGRFKRP